VTVKKAKATTLSLIALAAAIVLLLPVIRNALPYEVLLTLDSRMNPGHAFGSLYPLIVKAAIWLIVAAGVLDAILRNNAAFFLLSSMNVPIVLGFPIVIAAFVPSVSLHLFWAVFHIAVMIGIYWAFRKIAHGLRPGGQKLVSFVKEIKDAGGARKCHVADFYAAWGTALLLLAAGAIVAVSFFVFVAVHWGMLL